MRLNSELKMLGSNQFKVRWDSRISYSVQQFHGVIVFEPPRKVNDILKIPGKLNNCVVPTWDSSRKICDTVKPTIVAVIIKFENAKKKSSRTDFKQKIIFRELYLVIRKWSRADEELACCIKAHHDSSYPLLSKRKV